VTGHPQDLSDLEGYIVIDVEGNQKLAGVGCEPVVDEDLVPAIVGQGGLNRFEWQAVIMGDLPHVTVDRFQVAHERPDRYPIFGDTGLSPAGSVTSCLDIRIDQFSIGERRGLLTTASAIGLVGLLGSSPWWHV
jgi:hypothetical protein